MKGQQRQSAQLGGAAACCKHMRLDGSAACGILPAGQNTLGMSRPILGPLGEPQLACCVHAILDSKPHASAMLVHPKPKTQVH